MQKTEKSLSQLSLAPTPAPAPVEVKQSWVSQDIQENPEPRRPRPRASRAQPSATTVTSVAPPAAQVQAAAPLQEAKVSLTPAPKAKENKPKPQASKPAKTPAPQRAKGPRAEHGPNMFAQLGQTRNLVKSLPDLFASSGQDFEKAQEQIAELMQSMQAAVLDFTSQAQKLAENAKRWQDARNRESDLRKQLADKEAEIAQLKRAQAPKPVIVAEAQPLEQAGDQNPVEDAAEEEVEEDDDELLLPPPATQLQTPPQL